MIGICKIKATGHIHEMLGGGFSDDDVLNNSRLNALKQNALNAGYGEADVDVQWVDDVEYKAIKAEDPDEIARLLELEAIASAQAAKAQAFIDNLPSWDLVSTAVDNIDSLNSAKAFIKKLSRVVYWLAKGTAG